MKILIRFVLALLCFALPVGTASANTFPSKPIRLIVPFAAGGTSDILARIIGQSMSQSLGQPIIIENRPGAGGNIGSDIVAKSPPDGYTLILASVGTHAINPSLYSDMPYDPVKDFSPITLIANVPTVLVVNPSLRVHSMRELIAYARANPGKLNFASAGTGTTQQLAGEMLKKMTGIDMVHIPYKGGAPAVTALLSGEVSLMFPNIPVVHAYITSGKLRPLAVASEHRSPIMPNVPTVDEATGLHNFDVSTWFGVLASAGTPHDIIVRLHEAIVKAVDAPDVRAKFAIQGAEPETDTPAQFGAYIRNEVARWSKVVRGIKGLSAAK